MSPVLGKLRRTQSFSAQSHEFDDRTKSGSKLWFAREAHGESAKGNDNQR